MTPTDTGNTEASVDPVELSARAAEGDRTLREVRTSLEGVHPAVRSWFEYTFETPTPAQARGWEAIRSGRHTLISAPTGSGKTLAAFLDALDRLLREGIGAGELSDEARRILVRREVPPVLRPYVKAR